MQKITRRKFSASVFFILLLVITGTSPAGAVRNCINTGVPFLINGQDSDYDVEIILANYSDDYAYTPQFGKKNEAHWQLIDNNTIRVYFHPRTCYDKGCQYYLYVGIHHPMGLQSGKSCSRYDRLISVKNKQVNFEGSFRLVYGTERNRRSFYITPVYGYGNADRSDKKACAFNNYGGGDNTPLNQATMNHSERNWWHNIYWGTWYDKATMFPGDIDTPGKWVNFNDDLNQASLKAEALARKKWRLWFTEKPHFKTDRVVLIQASIGPEFNAGDGWLVFDIKDLNLNIR